MKPDADKRVSTHEIPPATHNGRAIVETDASKTEDVLIRWAARLKLPANEIQELIEDVQEAFHHEETMEETRANLQKVREIIEKAGLAKNLYIKLGGDAFMADRCMWLLLGFPVLSGCENLAQLVKLVGQAGFGKATVNKCLQHFQKQVHELPILPGQREMEARLNMKKARKNQL